MDKRVALRRIDLGSVLALACVACGGRTGLLGEPPDQPATASDASAT
jgi:hypothetical protein